MKLLLSLFCGTALTGFTQVLSAAPDSAKQWQVYDGYQAEGYGRHIVLISRDEEYRSEEVTSQLGKILALRQGFKCTLPGHWMVMKGEMIVEGGRHVVGKQVVRYEPMKKPFTVFLKFVTGGDEAPPSGKIIKVPNPTKAR